MTHFSQHDGAFFPRAAAHALLPELPAGNFVVAQSMEGLFFQQVEPFTDPGKLYGNIHAQRDRILRTFLSRPRATGVLLAGEKGSGKTQLAREVCREAYDAGIPSIIVNAPWSGDPFANLLASIEQPAIVVMDEFEKVYDNEAQESVLTLLDGTMTTKKLFILTVNNKYRVSEHMRNRPGRLFYMLEFDGLDVQFIKEYCVDNLDNQGHVDAVCKVSAMFDSFSFDLLKALVEEMNRYNEGPFEALDWLNAQVFNESYTTTYMIEAWDKTGAEVELAEGYNTASETPITSRGGKMGIYYTRRATKADVKSGEADDIGDRMGAGLVVRAKEIQKLDAEKGIYEFATQEGFKVIYTKKPKETYDLRQLAY